MLGGVLMLACLQPPLHPLYLRTLCPGTRFPCPPAVEEESGSTTQEQSWSRRRVTVEKL